MSSKNGDRAEHGGTREANGHWKPGHSGNPRGRPKGRFDYRLAVDNYAAEHDLDIAEAIGAVTAALIDSAKAGDTAAARLLFDRNCGPLRQELEVETTARTVTHLSDQTRAAIREMASDPETQRVVRAELRRKTRRNGRA